MTCSAPMENFFPIFPYNGKNVSTVWKTVSGDVRRDFPPRRRGLSSFFGAALRDEGLGLLAELVFLDLAAGGEGIFVHEEDVAGHFVGGEVQADEVADGFLGDGFAAVKRPLGGS